MFKGSDNTGSFATKGLKSQFRAFLASDDAILDAFSRFGNETFVPSDIHKQMERYTCLLYRPTNDRQESLKELRWTLFARSGKEGTQLPPTVGTLIPHTNRAYYNALLCKKSTVPCPLLPPPTDFSWAEHDGNLAPVFCTLPPAPEALLLLRKCGCSVKRCKDAACG